MPTVVLNLYTKAYPFISNRIRASVFLQSDPQALIASQIDTVSGHPARVWQFPGLPRTNYGFSLDEINGSGDPINNLALFDVVPSEIDGLLTRNDEQPKAGTTPGFDNGGTGFIFDGTEISPGVFKPNYIGWEIVPSELNGRGILIRGVDYTWDKDTAEFELLIPGDVFPPGQVYNIHFEPVQNPAGNSYPTIIDFECILITIGTAFDTGYFGKKVIAEPAALLIECTLPDILTVPVGRKLMIEVGGTNITCLKFKTTGSDIIKWLNGNILVHPNESLSIYRFRRSVGVDEWRVCDVFGNFATVGTVIASDVDQGDAFNMQLLDGSILSIKQYARLYEEFVLNLDPSQRCNFDDWSTGNNKYLYSLANSANPSFLDKFHIPDRRGLYEKNNNTGKPGDHGDWQMPDHQHEGTQGTLPSTLFGRGIPTRTIGQYNGTTSNKADLTSKPVKSDGTYITKIGLTNEVEHYLINKFVLI